MKTLEAIAKMAADDNKGLRMTTTIVNVVSTHYGKEVTFGTDAQSGNSAHLQMMGLPSEDLCVAFFINRKELEKYK